MEIEDKGSTISKIVEQCRKNNSKAQMQLYRMFSQRMFNTSLRIVGNKTLAEDVMQEAFLSAFEKIKDCKTPEHFGSWLKRIVINRSIDEIRKKRISFVPLEETIPLSDDSSEYKPEEEIEQEKLLEYIKQGITILPEGYRIVLSLKILEDYDYGTIAKNLNITESTVRSQFVRGRQKLLEIIENLKKKENE